MGESPPLRLWLDYCDDGKSIVVRCERPGSADMCNMLVTFKVATDGVWMERNPAVGLQFGILLDGRHRIVEKEWC